MPCRSTPATSTPRSASRHSAALPKPPSPTTTTSLCTVSTAADPTLAVRHHLPAPGHVNQVWVYRPSQNGLSPPRRHLNVAWREVLASDHDLARPPSTTRTDLEGRRACKGHRGDGKDAAPLRRDRVVAALGATGRRA